MKISVIIPIYNGAKYLKQAIESVLNQPYKNLEVLCVDDGSTDNSAEIVKLVASKDSRVLYYYKNNGGGWIGSQLWTGSGTGRLCTVLGSG